jgi:NhaP-type Na+/H+ or K+/H+ antiporter
MGFSGVELGIALPALEPLGLNALGIIAVVVGTIVIRMIGTGVIYRGGGFRVVLRRHRNWRKSW